LLTLFERSARRLDCGGRYNQVARHAAARMAALEEPGPGGETWVERRDGAKAMGDSSCARAAV